MARLFRVETKEQFVGGLEKSAFRNISLDVCRSPAENLDGHLMLIF